MNRSLAIGIVALSAVAGLAIGQAAAGEQEAEVELIFPATQLEAPTWQDPTTVTTTTRTVDTTITTTQPTTTATSPGGRPSEAPSSTMTTTRTGEPVSMTTTTAESSTPLQPPPDPATEAGTSETGWTGPTYNGEPCHDCQDADDAVTVWTGDGCAQTGRWEADSLGLEHNPEVCQ